MPDDKVILSEEPDKIKLNIQDPTKPANSAGKMIKVNQKIPVKDRVIGALFGPEVNSQNLGQTLVDDYAIPTGKRMLNNAAQNTLKRFGDAVQVLLFGKVINSTSGPTDYTSYSNPDKANAVKTQGVYRVMDQVDTFAFAQKNKAEECLAYLRGRIAKYGSVSVVDYFEWINTNLNTEISLDYNMTYRGWIDLSSARVSVAAEGFIIELPRPIALQRG